MIEIKNSFIGGLDLDTSLHSLRKDVYIDATNITRDAIAGNQDLAITNLIGNKIVSYSLPAGTNKCIGAFGFLLRNQVIYFVYNSNGHHLILLYSDTTRTITKIFENLTDSAGVDILGFIIYRKITSIAIYPRDEGDLLFFLDSLGRPTGLNIANFIAVLYTPVTREIIDIIKAPPLSPPSAVYGNDTTVRNNSLRKKEFRFKTIFVYDDFEESVPSPISIVPLPLNILDPVYTNVVTNNNVIYLSLYSGAKNVAKVKLLMSYAEASNDWSDFVEVVNIDKAAQSISDNVYFPLSFYNDSVYPVYNQVRSIQIQDYVPELANAMDMPNGNVLAFGGITEGYDRTLVPNVVNTILTTPASGGSTGNLNGVVSILQDGLLQTFAIAFSGIPIAGTVINVRVRQVNTGTVFLAATYTSIAGDTANSIAAAISASFNGLGQVFSAFATSNVVVVQTNAPLDPKRVFESIEILPPAVSAINNSIATWLWSTSRNIGIVYYDKNGKTNGVLYNAKVTFPAYAESGSNVLLPYINTKIYHIPPIWAASFTFVFTQDSVPYNKFWECSDVITTEANYLYFNVTNFDINSAKNPTTAQVLSYTFQDGDRMRLIKNTFSGVVFSDTFDSDVIGLVTDPKINSVDTIGKFIKIKNVAPFNTIGYGDKFFVIELWRPGQASANLENQVYFECGRQYPVLLPGTANRVHGGEVTDQTLTGTPGEFNFYAGDSYFRPRTIPLSDTGFATFSVQDRNFVDFYLSAVSSLQGRPSAIDINARRAYFGATIRHGEEYQVNTNVNGLNQFLPSSLIEASYSYGDIGRLVVKDKKLVILQTSKIGFSPLFSQIHKEAGGTLIAQTDVLLNPIQYYAGDYGIGTAFASVSSYNFAIYGIDNLKGVVWRLSNDGLIPISVLYKINSFCTDELPLRTGLYTVIGAFSQKSNNYVFSLEATDTRPQVTLAFDEDSNSFDGKISLFADYMVTLGTQFISFKDGQLYTHDNSAFYNQFFGVDYESNITMVFNTQGLEKKTWEAITEVANVKWDCPLIYTNVESYAGQRQETNLNVGEIKPYESNFSGSIKRDINSRKGKINGDIIKGNYIAIKFRVQNASNLIYLSIVSVRYVDSPLTTK